MSASDIEMEDINVTPRWSVAFEQGNAVVNVSPQHVQDLANGWFALFSFEREKKFVLMERGFGLTNQEPASIAALWEMILNQDVPKQLYFEGAIPLVDGREWCEVEGDVLRLNISVATHHIGIYRPRLDVIYLWPKDHESVLMRERPLGLTVHGYVHHGAVSLIHTSLATIWSVC
jgi:hypothetical protein